MRLQIIRDWKHCERSYSRYHAQLRSRRQLHLLKTTTQNASWPRPLLVSWLSKKLQRLPSKNNLQ